MVKVLPHGTTSPAVLVHLTERTISPGANADIGGCSWGACSPDGRDVCSGIRGDCPGQIPHRRSWPRRCWWETQPDRQTGFVRNQTRGYGHRELGLPCAGTRGVGQRLIRCGGEKRRELGMSRSQTSRCLIAPGPLGGILGEATSAG